MFWIFIQLFKKKFNLNISIAISITNVSKCLARLCIWNFKDSFYTILICCSSTYCSIVHTESRLEEDDNAISKRKWTFSSVKFAFNTCVSTFSQKMEYVLQICKKKMPFNCTMNSKTIGSCTNIWLQFIQCKVCSKTNTQKKNCRRVIASCFN